MSLYILEQQFHPKGQKKKKMQKWNWNKFVNLFIFNTFVVSHINFCFLATKIL